MDMTADDRDYYWQIHLSAELVGLLPATGLCSALSVQCFTIITVIITILSYSVVQKELYNFERVYKFIQRIYTTF
jgi:hypothetical protein